MNEPVNGSIEVVAFHPTVFLRGIARRNPMCLADKPQTHENPRRKIHSDTLSRHCIRDLTYTRIMLAKRFHVFESVPGR